MDGANGPLVREAILTLTVGCDMSENDLIEICEVDNPEYLAYSTDLHRLIDKFVREINVPAIKPDTLFAYLNQVVDSVHKAKLIGTNQNLIEQKMYVGRRNKVTVGFMLFCRMPEGMPYLRTMSWPYCYSEDIRVTRAFCMKVMEYKKKWKMRYVSMISTNPKLTEVAKKYFNGGNAMEHGTYMLFTGIRNRKRISERVEPETGESGGKD